MPDTLTSPAGSTANEEEVLAEAFPAIDATEEEVTRMAEVPPDAKLLEATPLPSTVDLEELEEEVSRTRVILIRGARAIPLTALISIGGALLFHALLVGGFLLALYFAVKLGASSGGGGGMMARGVGDGSDGGYMIVGELPGGITAEKSVADVLPNAVPPAMPEPPTLPAAPDSASVARQLVARDDLRLPDNAMIGVATNDRLGSFRVTAPPPPATRQTNQPKPTGVTVAPPPERNMNVLASAGSVTGSPSARGGGGGGGRGRGGEDDFGDEIIIPLSKGDGGGSGGGSGGGTGSGIGRGTSGANNPEPMILEWSSPEFPPAVYMNPPKRSAKFKVTVKANGEVGNVEIVESCGQSAIDSMWQTALKNAKYRPAYRAGKPYEAVKEVEYRFAK